MQKIWLEHYPPNVPEEINPDEYTSLSDFFEKKVVEYPRKAAYVNFDVEMTYYQLEQHSRHFANFLLQHLLLNKGDRVGIMLPNLLQFPVALWGILRAGLIAVTLNPLYTSAELEPILKDSGLQTIVVLSQCAQVIQHVSHVVPLKNIIITHIIDLYPTFKRIWGTILFQWKHTVPYYDLPHAISLRHALNVGKTTLFRPVTTETHDDIALLQYTAGTTSISKGVMLTHRNLLANIAQMNAWVSPILIPNKEIFITALPFHHIFSLTVNLFLPFSLGARNILVADPRDTQRLIQIIADAHFTVITGVNTTYHMLMKHPDFSRIHFTSLKIALAGGIALQPHIAEAWMKHTGKPILEAYGLSETSSSISMTPVTNTTQNSNVGLPLPSTHVEICDTTTHQLLGVNEIGEIWVNGPQVMKGYWHNISKTQTTLTHNGWLNTNDIGKIDEQGFLYMLERAKDIIIISGFNVYPAEIEQILIKHPDILEVAVVGLHRQEGETVIKACIVKRNPDLTREHVIAYCKMYLTAYKIPKIIEFYDSLPKSHIGKILKRELVPKK